MKSPIDAFTVWIVAGFALLALGLVAALWHSRTRRLRDVRNAVTNSALGWKWTLVWTKTGDYPEATITGTVEPYPFTASLSWQAVGASASKRALFAVSIPQTVAHPAVLSVESPFSDRALAIPGSSSATARVTTSDMLFDSSFHAMVNMPDADRGLLKQDVRSEILRMWNPRLLVDPRGLTIHVWLPTEEPTEVSATIERTVFFLVKLAKKRAALPSDAPG